MKKYLLLIFLALFCMGAGQMYDYGPTDLYGEGSLKFVDQVESGGEACTLEESFGAATGSIDAFNEADRVKVATEFTTGGSGYTLTKVEAVFRKAGDPSFTITAKIYDNNVDEPGSQTGTDSGAVAASGLPTDDTYTAWTWGTGVSLDATTTYWVVWVASAAGNETDHADLRNNSGASDGRIESSPSAENWTFRDGDAQAQKNYSGGC